MALLDLRRGGYEEDLRRAVDVLQAAAGQTAGVLSDPAPSVRVRELGSADIELAVRFWTDSRRTDFVATASSVRAEAVAALRAAGIGLPAPDRRVVVPGAPMSRLDEASGARP